MSLSIQERLKDLRVERGLTLGQLAEQTRAFQVCAGPVTNGRLQGHQPLCPYPAGEVLRCDR